jgi:hypothetical protein
VLRRLLELLRDFFTDRQLVKARERHRKAADGLDTAVKEMLKK